jgi:hypothetical protein
MSGAIVGAAVYGLIGDATIWIAVAFSGVLAAVSAAISQPE